MFGMHHNKNPTGPDTLEHRIRTACGEALRVLGKVLIALRFDEEHTRAALVIRNPHDPDQRVTLLLEPSPGSHVTDCIIVVGDEIHDDPHGMSIWPVADEHFMAQFKGKPHAVVSYWPEGAAA